MSGRTRRTQQSTPSQQQSGGNQSSGFDGVSADEELGVDEVSDLYGMSAATDMGGFTADDDDGMLSSLDTAMSLDEESEGDPDAVRDAGAAPVHEEPPEGDPEAEAVETMSVETEEEELEGDGGGGDEPAVESADGGEGPPAGGGGGDPEGGGPLAVEPAALCALPEITTPIAPVLAAPGNLSDAEVESFLDSHGMTPDQAHSQIQASLNTLTADITAAQSELIGTAADFATSIRGAAAEHVTAIESHITGARDVVTGAFDGLSGTLTGAKESALSAISEHRTTGEGVISDAYTAESGRLTAAFTSAQGAVDTLMANESGPMETVLQQLAEGLVPIAEEKKQAAQTKGTELASTYDPSQHDASSGLAEGKASLLADVRKKTAEELSKSVADRIEAKLLEHSTALSESAPQMVTEAIEPYQAALTETIAQSEESGVAALDAAELQAQQALTDGETDAIDTVNAAEIACQEKIETESAASVERFDAAGQTLRDAISESGEELANRVEVRAAEDAEFYARLVRNIEAALADGGPYSPDQVQPLIDDAYAQLQENHGPNLDSLTVLAEEGSGELDREVDSHKATFNEAVTAEEGEAVRVAGEIDSEMAAGAETFGGGVQGLGDHFNGVVSQQITQVETATTSFQSMAQEGLAAKREQMATTVATSQTAIGTEMQGWVDAIDQQVLDQSQSKYEAKLNTLRARATNLRKHMDGLGTDENGIYGEMRDLSYGEIEALEAIYDDHYAHRASNGMRPLRFDLQDEMEGSDLDIATNYLNHNRDEAIRLELDDSLGFWNDDEARIEAVLRTCTDDEIAHLNTNPDSIATLGRVRGSLGGADLDTVNALVDTSVSQDRRLIHADAIRLFDSMDGMGTDEARARAILEGADTPEKRAMLREYFNSYAEAEGQWEGEDGRDRLDEALQDDFGGTELVLMQQLALTERNDQAVAMARMLDAGDGGGTNETDVFSALDDTAYAERWENATPEQRVELERERQAALNAQVAALSDDYDSVDAFLDHEMGADTGISYEEARRGTKDDGTAVTAADIQRMNLERAVAERKLQTGRAEPDLMIRWAVEGGGTDEAAIKAALGAGGSPKSRAAVRTICEDYRRIWGETLRGHDELERLDFDNFAEPSGRLCNELGGSDWLDVRILLCGKPETAEQVRYVTMLRVDFETSGLVGDGLMAVADGLGFTDTRSDMLAQQERFDDEYAAIPEEMRDDPLSTLGERGARIEELGEYLASDAQAYGNMKASIVDAIVTTLEIIGGIIASVVTAGAASPLLAAVIASLIVSAAGIVVRAATLGDRYGAAELGADVGRALLSAATAGMAEVGSLQRVGQAAGNAVLTRVATEAGEQGGMRLLGVAGWELSERGQAIVVNMIGQGVTNTATDSVNRVGSFMMDERTYDMTLDDALWGEQGLGASLAQGIPSSFASGVVSTGVSESIGDQSSLIASAGRGSISEMSGNTAGYVTDYSHYNDAGQFWEGLGTSNIQSGLSGAGTGVAERMAAPRNAGRQLMNGEVSAADLDGPDFAYLTDADRAELAQFVADNGQADLLPASYRQHLDQSPPTDNGGTGNDTPAVVVPVVNDEEETPLVVVTEEEETPIVIDEEETPVVEIPVEETVPVVVTEDEQTLVTTNDQGEAEELDLSNLEIGSAVEEGPDVTVTIWDDNGEQITLTVDEYLAMQEAAEQTSHPLPETEELDLSELVIGSALDDAQDTVTYYDDDGQQVTVSVEEYAAMMDGDDTQVADHMLHDLEDAIETAPVDELDESTLDESTLDDSQLMSVVTPHNEPPAVDVESQLTLVPGEIEDTALVDLARRAVDAANNGDLDGAAEIESLIHQHLSHETQEDTPFSQAINRGVDADEQQQIASDLTVLMGTMGTDIRDLTPDQMDALIRANSHLARNIEEGMEMRKVIPDSAVGKNLAGAYDTAITNGSVADGRNTAGLTSEQIVAILGLDYDNTPYLTPTGGAQETVFYVQYALTGDMQADMQIPLDGALVAHAQAMALAGDQDAAYLVDNDLLRTRDQELVDIGGTEVVNTDNPFWGGGATTHGTQYTGDSHARPNQEFQHRDGSYMPMLVGSQLYAVDSTGHPVLVATLSSTGGVAGTSPWTVSPSLQQDAPQLYDYVQILIRNNTPTP